MIVTFSNMIESKGKVEGEIGDLSENISNDFRSEGSIKEGEVVGLEGSVDVIGVVVLWSGGKSSNAKGGGDIKGRIC